MKQKMDANAYIRERIAKLLILKGITTEEVSLAMGHKKDYYDRVLAGTALPRMRELLKLLDYLQITPRTFFDPQIEDPFANSNILYKTEQMDEDELKAVLGFLECLKKIKTKEKTTNETATPIFTSPKRNACAPWLYTNGDCRVFEHSVNDLRQL